MAVKLVTISEYARHWNIQRPTVYLLIKKKVLTRYEDPDGNPLLDIKERPAGVKSYAEIRTRKIRR